MASGADHPGPLATRLNSLFETVRKPDGSTYSLREVADTVTAAGQPISHAYIGQLRTGQKRDPNLSHLRALAGFFQVPVEYFTSDQLAASVDSDLILASALQQVQARTDAALASVIPQAEAALRPSPACSVRSATSNGVASTRVDQLRCCSGPGQAHAS